MNYSLNYAELDSVTLLDLLASETSKLTGFMVNGGDTETIKLHKSTIKSISAELEKRKKADMILPGMLPHLDLPDTDQPNH